MRLRQVPQVQNGPRSTGAFDRACGTFRLTMLALGATLWPVGINRRETRMVIRRRNLFVQRWKQELRAAEAATDRIAEATHRAMAARYARLAAYATAICRRRGLALA